MSNKEHPRQQPELLTPEEIIAPGVGNARLLTSSQHRRHASAADLAPAAPRTGSADHKTYPSRLGNTLRHADGRITDLNGRLLGRRMFNHQEKS